jgi:hypothetical protein
MVIDNSDKMMLSLDGKGTREIKDTLKATGFKWDGSAWMLPVREFTLEEEDALLWENKIPADVEEKAKSILNELGLEVALTAN